MSFSGFIPTIQVSKNSSLNTALGGVLNNVATGAVNVAVSPYLSTQWRNTLGLTSLKPQDLISSIVTPGILDYGNQAISQALTNSLGGVAGPLVSGVLSPVLGQLSQQLLGVFLPTGTDSPTKYFPGAGDEPLADFDSGNVFSPSRAGGLDVVFSIKPASMTSAQEVASQTTGNGPGTVSSTLPAGQNPSTSSGTPATTPATQAAATSAAGAAAATPISTNASSTGAAAAVTSSNSTPQGSPGFFKKVFSFLSGNKTPTLTQNAASNKAPAPPQTGVWNFICAPEEVSWETSAQVDRVAIFGTNFAPVVSGSRGMRELSMSNALVEGFTRAKTVENKISDLENLMKFSLDTNKSYVKVPVFWVSASDKKYGGADGGCFVIKSVRVKEEMRDLAGLTTRARVDISFVQVPEYQVDDGRDIASKTVSGASSSLGVYGKEAGRVNAQANQGQGTKTLAAQVPATKPTGSSTRARR